MGLTSSVDGDVLVLRLDNAPVNALSTDLRADLADAVARAQDDPAVAAVVIAGAGKHFSGGADIRGFGRPPEPPALPDVIATIEASAKRFYAAIDGTALGGGLEVALACDARYATPRAKLGLPEVNLGLLPGAGGTQRLPRLIGMAPAIELITSGKPVSAARALELGLIDGIVEGDPVAAAVAKAKADAGRERRRTGLRPVVADAAAVAAVRATLPPADRGGLAVQRAADAVEAAATSATLAAGLARERELFMELLASEQSKSRIHIFFAERDAAKVPDVPATVEPVAFERVTVIGAGTMGAGIAMALADGGLGVRVVEASSEALVRGRELIEKNYRATASKGRMSQADVADRLGRISFESDLAGAVADADVVVEAVFEDLDVKRAVFAQLDTACRPGTLLATNTSTLDIDAIATATSRPQDVIGLHFFSPANVMRLLEIVRGSRTTPQAIATAFALAKRIKKIGVLARSCDGFIGNRMLAGYGREAAYLAEEGASPQEIDGALRAFGLAMGYFAMADLAGLDVGWRIKQRRAAEGRSAHLRETEIFDRLCEAGHFGQKTGTGVYRYEAGNRTPQRNPAFDAILAAESQRLGIERRPIAADEILTRCMLPLVNEGANILLDGTAIRASDIDVVWVYGYGFPAWRGGPMRYADSLGLGVVRDEMRRLRQRHGDRWRPSPLVEQLADTGGSFAGYRARQPVAS